MELVKGFTFALKYDHVIHRRSRTIFVVAQTKFDCRTLLCSLCPMSNGHFRETGRSTETFFFSFKCTQNKSPTAPTSTWKVNANGNGSDSRRQNKKWIIGAWIVDKEVDKRQSKGEYELTRPLNEWPATYLAKNRLEIIFRAGLFRREELQAGFLMSSAFRVRVLSLSRNDQWPVFVSPIGRSSE